MLRWTLWLGIIVVALAGCLGGGLWVARNRLEDHRLPLAIPIYVAVAPEVADADDGGLLAALVDSLDEELRSEGHTVTIVGARADEKAPLPRLELQLIKASGGDAKMRGAGNLVGFFAAPVGVGLAAAGRGLILVDCYVVQRDERVTFAGRIEAGSIGHGATGYSTSGAEFVGRAIAKAVSN